MDGVAAGTGNAYPTSAQAVPSTGSAAVQLESAILTLLKFVHRVHVG